MLEFEPDGTLPFGASAAQRVGGEVRGSPDVFAAMAGMFVSTRCNDGDLVVGRLAEATPAG